MSVECIKYTPINKGSLVGYADIYVEKWDFEIYGCSLHESNGKRWINLPQKEYVDRTSGEKKYTYINKFRQKRNFDLFTTAIRDAVEKKCKEISMQKNIENNVYQEETQMELPF